MSKRHSTIESFGYALSGIKIAIKNEPNIRVHYITGILVVLLAIVLKVTTIEFAILLLTIGIIIILELINTALEALVNIVSPEIQPQAKVAKDVCAAAVFTGAATAILVGAFIFIPRLLFLVGL